MFHFPKPNEALTATKKEALTPDLKHGALTKLRVPPLSPIAISLLLEDRQTDWIIDSLACFVCHTPAREMTLY